MEKKEILNNLLSQINAFDSKASILVTAVGVVFALVSSLLLDSNLSAWQSESSIGIVYKVLFLLFLLISLIVMFCMVMVILPRRRKDDRKLYPNYYLDITKIEKEKLDDAIKNIDIDGQIKINAAICTKKEIWFRRGILLLIPFAIILIILVCFVIFI